MKTRTLKSIIIREAGGESPPSFESELKSFIEQELGVNIEVDSYTENKDEDEISFYFIIGKESVNLYFQLDYSDNTLNIYLLADPRDKSEIESGIGNESAQYAKPIPITGNENIPDLIYNLRRLSESSLKSKILDYLS